MFSSLEVTLCVRKLELLHNYFYRGNGHESHRELGDITIYIAPSFHPRPPPLSFTHVQQAYLEFRAPCGDYQDTPCFANTRVWASQPKVATTNPSFLRTSLGCIKHMLTMHLGCRGYPIIHIHNNVMWDKQYNMLEWWNILWNTVSPTKHYYGSEECYELNKIYYVKLDSNKPQIHDLHKPPLVLWGVTTHFIDLKLLPIWRMP